MERNFVKSTNVKKLKKKKIKHVNGDITSILAEIRMERESYE